MLNFFGPVSIWDRYAEGGRAVNESEMISNDCRMERTGGGGEVRIHLDQPRSTQTIPARYGTASPTGGIGIHQGVLTAPGARSE